MSFGSLAKKFERAIIDNSPVILTSLGVSGALTTAYLAGKAAYEIGGYNQQFKDLSKKEKFKIVWKKYIPATISGALTVTCIIMGNRVSSKRIAAAYSLLSVSEKAFDEYKAKIVEQIGPKKEQAVRDAIAQDRVNQGQTVVVAGTGTVLCYEMCTGRYFNSDIETIRKAQNTVNAQMFRENEATLNDLYYLLGIPQTSYSSKTGWTSDKLLEISFSAVMAEDGKPCLAFEYNYLKPL